MRLPRETKQPLLCMWISRSIPIPNTSSLLWGKSIVRTRNGDNIVKTKDHSASSQMQMLSRISPGILLYPPSSKRRTYRESVLENSCLIPMHLYRLNDVNVPFMLPGKSHPHFHSAPGESFAHPKKTHGCKLRKLKTARIIVYIPSHKKGTSSRISQQEAPLVVKGVVDMEGIDIQGEDNWRD